MVGEHLQPNDVVDFCQGLLPTEAQVGFEAHLADCEGCQAMVAESLKRSTSTASGDGAAPVNLGRFEVKRCVGSGAMGLVFDAHDPQLDRRVALKLLREGKAGTDAHQRTLAEARAMAKVNHPNVVAVHEVGLADGQLFLVMDFVEGTTLTRYAEQHRADPRRLLSAFSLAGRGLAAAHRAGVVHRDFKADNVLVDASGAVRVTDFGLAMTGAAALERAGTPVYMAPEVLAGLPATAASDQFSFCLSLYEALAGRRPWSDADALTRRQPAAALAVPGVSGRARRALQRGLSLDPQARFATLDDLLRQLEPPSRAPLLAAAAVVAALLVAGLSVKVAMARAACPPLPGRAELWTADQRARVERLLQSDPEVQHEVLLALDRNVAELDVEVALACQAEPGPQSARQQLCLLDSLSRVSVAVSALEAVPAERAMYAQPVVRTLPEPASCRSVAALSEVRTPPQTEPELTFGRQARVLYWQAESERRLGEWDEALALATRAEADARRALDLSLAAWALRTQGRMLNVRYRYPEGTRRLQQAVETARAAGDMRALGLSAFNLAINQCFSLEHEEPCRAAVAGVEEAAARGLTDELRAALAELRAILAGRERDAAEAVRQAELAQSLWRRVPQALEDELRVRENLLFILEDDERPDVALAELELLLPSAAHFYGLKHPRYGRNLERRATLLLGLGRLSEAAEAVAGDKARAPLSDTTEARLKWLQGDVEGALVALDAYLAQRKELRAHQTHLTVLSLLGRWPEAARWAALMEQEVRWREQPARPGVDATFILPLARYYELHEPKTLEQFLPWALVAVRPSREGAEVNAPEGLLQLIGARAALGRGDLEAAGRALEVSEAMVKARAGATFATRIAVAAARAELTRRSGDAAAAAAQAKQALDELTSRGAAHEERGRVELTLGLALLEAAATRAEGCASLRAGLERLAKYPGIDVTAERQRLRRECR